MVATYSIIHHILTLFQFLVGAAWSSSNQVISFLLSPLILFLSPSLVPWRPVLSHHQPFPHLGFCPFPTHLLLEGIKNFLQDELKPPMLQPGLCSGCRGADPKAVPLPCLLPSPPGSCLPGALTGPAGEWRRGNVIFSHVYNERKRCNKRNEVKRFSRHITF